MIRILFAAEPMQNICDSRGFLITLRVERNSDKTGVRCPCLLLALREVGGREKRREAHMSTEWRNAVGQKAEAWTFGRLDVGCWMLDVNFAS